MTYNSNDYFNVQELTMDIDKEVESQNKLLDGMSLSMFDTSGMLSGTVQKINSIMARGGSTHMCYLVIFIIFAFLAIWYILKRKG